MDEIQEKETVLVSHKLLSDPRGNRGKTTYFMACGRDERVQWV